MKAESLPLRERGLKLRFGVSATLMSMSLPLRERGLKLRFGVSATLMSMRRSPCGSVD